MGYRFRCPVRRKMMCSAGAGEGLVVKSIGDGLPEGMIVV
jgi:hypothetical protein